MNPLRTAVLCLIVFAAVPAYAQTDAEGCKDSPLFGRLQNFHIADCDSKQSQLKRFPVGPPINAAKKTALEEVEGSYLRIHYVLNDGATKPGALQTMRDFEKAARNGGATVVGQYPDKCKAVLDDSMHGGDDCIDYGITVKSTSPGKEVWAFMESTDEGGGYELRVAEREVAPKAGTPDPVVNEMLEKIIKEGYVTVHINFDIGQASIKQESIPTIAQIVEMMKLAPELNIEVAGHTDSIGSGPLNQALSESRAQSVVKTLIESGVPESRLSAKGYGESKPVADNKTREGRAQNRRVELIKR